MDLQNKSGLRELQIAQGLVTLRWVAIPLLFVFGILATHFLGMSFPVTPVYILACFLAFLNVYFTIHISMLSRQLMMRRGYQVLKRHLLTVINNAMNEVKGRGPLALLTFPRAIFKLMALLYLMILESFKGVRFNLLSLENIMHCQVIVDIAAITAFVRVTGASESPLVILWVIPIIIAGAVMGFYRGGVYAVAASLAYLFTCLLVNFKLITHMKFYGPQYGDLSLSLGWTFSSFIMLMVALLGTAYLAHNLTAIFKERIFFLHQLLDRNRRDSIAQSGVAENVGVTWFILDSMGNVMRYRRGASELFPIDLIGKNLFDAVGSFKQHGLGYILQSVMTGGKPKEVGRIKIQSGEGTIHTVNCRMLPMVDGDNRVLALLIAEDITEIIFLKERVNELKEGLDTTRSDLEKASLDAKEANLQLVKSLKQANDRSVEIAQMMTRVGELEEGKSCADDQVYHLMKELATVKASNDTLSAELKYKQMILEEIIELLKNCSNLDQLATMIEHRSKALFKLDNACLHIFRNHQVPGRMNEILDTHKASPRLLDLPRNNPKVLEPVLHDGKPVVIMAEVHPDKSASLAITNGSLRRLVAYIPIRNGQEIIGMMMLDRYGIEENTEKFLEMLVYYLGNTAFALKNAIMAREWETQREHLEQTVGVMENHIAGFVNLINAAPASGDVKAFETFLQRLGAFCGAADAMMIRFHDDGTLQRFSRLDVTRGEDLTYHEEEMMKALQANPAGKKLTRDIGDGKTLMGYPLSQGNKLCGVLMLHFAENRDGEKGFVDVLARLAGEHLALFSLQEEKELWENFYRENLQA
jgi:hypothetical protein